MTAFLTEVVPLFLSFYNFFRYGLSNCLFAATYDEILKQCSCVPFFHTMAWNDYPRICAGKSLSCMNKILTNIGSHTHVNDVNGVRRQCYSPCTDQVRIFRICPRFFCMRHRWNGIEQEMALLELHKDIHFELWLLFAKFY